MEKLLARARSFSKNIVRIIILPDSGRRTVVKIKEVGKDQAKKYSGHSSNKAFDRYCQIGDDNTFDMSQLMAEMRGKFYPLKKQKVAKNELKNKHHICTTFFTPTLSRIINDSKSLCGTEERT